MKKATLILFLFGTAIIHGCNPSKKSQKEDDREIISRTRFTPTNYAPVQIKYANILGTKPDSLWNVKLYAFIDEWLHTPYKWGGEDKSGIDCSAFVRRLLASVYDIHIPRTSITQFFNTRIEKFKSTKFLHEGDLIFFTTDETKAVSHVGLYLHNNLFVNSSSSKGVSIASLNDRYWKTKLVAAGRVKIN